MSDDDVLKDYDLDAWEAPEAPDDLADGVIGRLGGTEVSAAVPVEPASPRRRAWIIGGVAAAVVAATLGTYAVISATRREGPTSGSVLAARAQPLVIDGVKAELDRDADVRWTKDGAHVRVEQRAGTAAWRVDDKTTLVVDAGATVASVEASGASLRVEVQMNAMDGKIIGGSAVTAMAVALVTVVVYEGHVKVSGAGQHTVIVEPGSTWTSAPPAPVVQIEPVVGGGATEDEIEISRDPFDGPQPSSPDDDQAAPVKAGSGSDATVDQTCDEVSCVLDNYAGACCSKYQPDRKDRVPAPVKASTCDEVACVLSYYDPCCAAFLKDPRPPAPTSASKGLDRQMITDAIAKVKPQIRACGEKYPANGKVKLAVKVDSGGKVTNVEVKETPSADLGTCVAQVIAGARFAATDTGGSFSYPFVFEAEVQPSCDATKLADEGMEKLNEGMHAAALAKFEASLACESDPKTVKLAYLSACNSRNAAKAKLYFLRMTAVERDRFKQICVRNNIDLDGSGGGPADPFASPRPVTCDAAALTAKGRTLAAQDEHADALEKFEEALRCKPSTEVLQLAFTAACNSSDYLKAKQYYPKLSADAQKKLALACARNNVPYDDSTKCDADALKDAGMEKVNMGQHAAALALFEQSLMCKPDSYVTQLAFMASCNSLNSPKARKYYVQMKPAQQHRFQIMCERNRVEYLPDGAQARPVSCDADALKDEGMEHVTMGMHAAALAKFEASLACKQDPYVTQLAFMSSCNSANSSKAKAYYKQLSPAQRSKFKVICERNKVDFDDGAPVPASGKGVLEVMSKPAAKIIVDGVDTGLTTPITGGKLQLTPGKHKVTFVVDGNRYTYAVDIVAGGTLKLSKDLQ